MLLASATDAIGSSGFLGFVLGGGLLTAVIGGYRFLVNARLTERGMARDRVDQAARAEQKERKARVRAEREATLWQNRCGDMEYALRAAGIKVPPIDAELHVLAFSGNAEAADVERDGPARTRSRKTRRREDEFGDLDARLRTEEQDEYDHAHPADSGSAE